MCQASKLYRFAGPWGSSSPVLHYRDGETEAQEGRSWSWDQVPNVWYRALFTCFQWSSEHIENYSHFTDKETEAQIPRTVGEFFHRRRTVIDTIAEALGQDVWVACSKCVPLKFQRGENYPQVRGTVTGKWICFNLLSLKTPLDFLSLPFFFFPLF